MNPSVKLYWNERFPEDLYCVVKNKLYILGQIESIDPETGLDVDRDLYTWQHTSWSPRSSDLKDEGFEFIGEIGSEEDFKKYRRKIVITCLDGIKLKPSLRTMTLRTVPVTEGQIPAIVKNAVHRVWNNYRYTVEKL